MTAVPSGDEQSVVVKEQHSRSAEVAALADRIVVAHAAGESYLLALAELCSLCEAAGIEHAAVLDDAVRRAEQAT